MTRKSIILILGILLVVAIGLSVRSTAASGNQDDKDSLITEGRDLFYKQLKMALRLHPRAFSLEAEDVDRILEADTRLTGLYGAVIRILYLEQAENFPSQPSGSEPAPSSEFRTAWLNLCREGAVRFIQSLFLSEPLPVHSKAEHTVLDQVLSSLGLAQTEESDKGIVAGQSGSQDPSILIRALKLIKSEKAHTISRGEGVTITVIGPGKTKAAGLDPGNDIPWMIQPPVGTEQLDSPAAAAAAAAAPEAVVRFWPIRRNRDSAYLYWSALQTALTIREAFRSGARVVVVATSFAVDYPFLRTACLEAYRNHAVIVCGVGQDTGIGPGTPQSFPSHYSTTLAVAGIVLGRNNRLSPRPGEAASHFSDLAAPDNTGSTTVPETAAGLCGAAAAMISSQMPPTEEDLPGQYFQRIREILVRSADKNILNRRHFDPRMGYGLLDTANAAGKELEDYQARRKQIEDDFKRRLEARTKAQEEVDKARKEAEAQKK